MSAAMTTTARQSIARVVHVPSSALRAGDLVLTHGMRVRIPEPTRYDPGTGVGRVTSARGIVENPDDHDLTGLIPAAWMHEPERDGTPRWTVHRGTTSRPGPCSAMSATRPTRAPTAEPPSARGT